MDSSPDVLADTVRAKRIALDNDLELLRVKAQAVHPQQAAMRWGKTVVPAAAGLAALWYWQRHRRSIDTLADLLVQELRELYRTELQLVPALRRMRDAAANPDLAAVFTVHAEETQVHIERLERVFRSIGARPTRGKSAAIAGIELEGLRLLKRKADPDVRDALIIALAQRIEHLEIASYGTCRAHAETLGYDYAADLLQQTLEEERAVDAHLTHLAQRFVNVESIR